MINVQVFSGFRRKLAHTKTQQRTDKSSKHTGCTVFTRVSSGGVNFVFYPLSYLHFISSLFAPTSLFASASATAGVPPTPRGISGGHHVVQLRGLVSRSGAAASGAARSAPPPRARAGATAWSCTPSSCGAPRGGHVRAGEECVLPPYRPRAEGGTPPSF